MQKLQVKLKNAPTDTSLVCSSVSSGLNKVEKPSDQSIVRTCNNSEETHRVSCSRIELESTYGKNSTISGKTKKGSQFIPGL